MRVTVTLFCRAHSRNGREIVVASIVLPRTQSVIPPFWPAIC
jgi:hypothetical protein